MPAGLSPQQVAAKWARQMSGASQSYKDGIQGVSESPMAKAAANVVGWVAGVQQAADNGKYRDGLMSVSLESWKDKCITVGAARLSQGAAAATPVMEQFFAQLLPYTSRVSAQIQAMPSGTIENSRDRMNANFEAMRNFRFRKLK